jgi:predicted nucleic acid-binding Zn finger protein
LEDRNRSAASEKLKYDLDIKSRGTISAKMKRNAGSREERAEAVIRNSGVKLHRFEPSGREIWTVLGSDGDLIVDLSDRRAPYCSCGDFYFRVQAGQVRECYHLIAAKKAKDAGSFSLVRFEDEEFYSFVTALIADLFARAA